MDISGLTSTYLNYADTLTGTNGKSANSISTLRDKDLSKASEDELMEVCKEFESYFMEMIMKEMTKTTSLFGEEGSGSNSALVGYFKDGESRIWQRKQRNRTVSGWHRHCMSR